MLKFKTILQGHGSVLRFNVMNEYLFLLQILLLNFKDISEG
jgi:hypothetical protein